MPGNSRRSRFGYSWVKQVKPVGGFSAIEKNPKGLLAANLQIALVPDGPNGVGGLIDYARPNRKFTTGGTVLFDRGQYRNHFTGGGFNAANHVVNLSPSMAAPGNNWTCSWLGLYDGSNHATYSVLLSTGTAGVDYIGYNAGNPGLFVGNNSTGSIGDSLLDPGALTGWYRITVTVTGTAGKVFLQGQFFDNTTGTIKTAMPALTQILNDVVDGPDSWGWPVADIFFWNRTLKDNEVLTHFMDPYGTTLRPRMSERLRIGFPTIQNNAIYSDAASFKMLII